MKRAWWVNLGGLLGEQSAGPPSGLGKVEYTWRLLRLSSVSLRMQPVDLVLCVSRSGRPTAVSFLCARQGCRFSVGLTGTGTRLQIRSCCARSPVTTSGDELPNLGCQKPEFSRGNASRSSPGGATGPRWPPLSGELGQKIWHNMHGNFCRTCRTQQTGGAATWTSARAISFRRLGLIACTCTGQDQPCHTLTACIYTLEDGATDAREKPKHAWCLSLHPEVAPPQGCRSNRSILSKRGGPGSVH